MSEENLGASSGGSAEGGQNKKLILKRESCSCDSGDRVSDTGSRRSKSIGGIQLRSFGLCRSMIDQCPLKWSNLHPSHQVFLAQRNEKRNMRKQGGEYSTLRKGIILVVLVL